MSEDTYYLSGMVELTKKVLVIIFEVLIFLSIFLPRSMDWWLER